MLKPLFSRTVEWVLTVAAVVAIIALPSGSRLSVPSKAVRQGPFILNMDGKTEAPILWQESPSGKSSDSLALQFEVRLSAVGNTYPARLFVSSNTLDQALKISVLDETSLVIDFPVWMTGGDIESRRVTQIIDISKLISISIFINKITRTFEVRVNDRSHDLNALAYRGRNDGQGVAIDLNSLKFGGLGVVGRFEDIGFAIGSVPFNITSTNLRLLLIGLLVIFGTRRLAGRRVYRAVALRSWIKSTIGLAQIAFLGLPLILGVISAQTAFHKQTFTSEASLRRSTPLLQENSLRDLQLKARIRFHTFPANQFAYVLSFGRHQGRGFHVTIDKYGSLFVVLGSISESPDDFGLIRIGDPRIGDCDIDIQMKFAHERLSFLSISVDGKSVPIQSANNKPLKLEYAKVLPARYFSQRTSQFETKIGSVSSIRLVLENSTKRAIGAVMLYCSLLPFLASCWFRRRHSRI